MQNAASLENLTLKELGAIASAAQVPRWSRLKKAELLVRLAELGSALPTLDEALKVRAAKRAAAVGAVRFVAPLIAAAELETQKKAEERSQNDAKSLTSNEKTKTEQKSARRLAKSETKSFEKTKLKNKAPKKNALKTEAETSVKSSKPEPKTSESPSKPEPKTSESSLKSESERRLDAPPSRVSYLKEKMRRRQTLGRETDKRDRLLLTVCDAHWLRACWEITPRLVERIRSAMGRHWHTADPTLRLYKIDREPQGATRREFVADVLIRGGVDNWYVDVDDPPSCFLVELGYLARDKQFFTLISSNVVETPRQSFVDAFGRPAGGAFEPETASNEFGAAFPPPPGFSGGAFGFPAPSFSANSAFSFDAPHSNSISDSKSKSRTKFGGAFEDASRSPNAALSSRRDFRFEIDAEIVVKGVAPPGAQVRVKEEAVRVDASGAFSVRFRLPERRHVFPVVATSADGIETQTIVLAVDRNTKTLELTFNENAQE